ncbi:serine hydrolase domain-containing protein [Pseudoalteromonas sp. UG3-1]
MAKTLLLVLTLVLMSVNVKAQLPAQLDPKQVVSQFLRVFNSNNLETITHYVDNHLSEETAARWQGAGTKRYIIYTMNSSLSHKSLQQVGDIAQEEQQQRVRITAPITSKATGLDYELVINVGAHAPHSLISWYLTPSDRNKPDGKVSEAEMVKVLSELIKKLAKNGVFSGAVLLAKGEEILLQQAHGLASRRYDVKNNLETKFQIGSMNKMFTGIAIMQLVEAGKLSLNDKLTQYVDREYFGTGNFDAITIAQLLTHTSGLGAVPSYQAKQTEIRTLKQRLGLYKEVQLNFPPGSRWGYSSTGMDMLGHVIEAVTQQSYYDYIDDNIYHKAKMLSSGSFDIDLPVKNTARGYWYSIDTKAITENLVKQHVKGSPAGGGYSP